MKTNSNNQAGKGDKPRPVSLLVYHQNYDFIFRKKDRELKAAIGDKTQSNTTKNK